MNLITIIVFPRKLLNGMINILCLQNYLLNDAERVSTCKGGGERAAAFILITILFKNKHIVVFCLFVYLFDK